MRDDQTLIDDVMTLGGNLLGNLIGSRHELKAQAKQRVEHLAKRLDLVSRDEFNAAFAMLAKARAMQEDLNARLTKIEAHLKLASPKPAKKAAKPSLPSVKKSKRAGKRR